MNIKDFSERSHISAHTLRYYEKIGLLTDIQRNSSGHREYNAKDMEWVAFIVRLKETGMSLENIIQYAQLRALGESTVEQRQKLLELHRDQLHSKIENERLHLKALDKKIKYYKTLLT